VVFTELGWVLSLGVAKCIIGNEMVRLMKGIPALALGMVILALGIATFIIGSAMVRLVKGKLKPNPRSPCPNPDKPEPNPNCPIPMPTQPVPKPLQPKPLPRLAELLVPLGVTIRRCIEFIRIQVMNRAVTRKSTGR
jgi:hypothetical protein